MKKNLKAYFHRVVLKNDEIYSFLNNFDLNKKPQSEKINDFYFYISDVEKEEIFLKAGLKTNLIYFTLSKSDTTEQIKIDNVETQERREVEKNDNEGLGKDAHFCLVGNILIQRKTRSVATIYDLQQYFASKLAVDKKQIEFDLILEKDVLEKFDRATVFKEFKFRIATPSQLGLFADMKGDELAKLNLANDFNADSLTFEVKSKQLNKSKIQEIIDIFHNNSTTAEFKSLSAIGENEFLDFVKYKLFYSEEIEMKKSEELTAVYIFPFLKNAFENKKEYLDAYQN
ncbi:hypothetical protein [Pseudolactococcus laudensis]|uniref:hypothetical protein n=2 Tax=Pseudolactococcus laudensis TaxID=1494461 RepID=UPI00027750B4|nr:phage protein [Lactococcus raffinolactis 4877]